MPRTKAADAMVDEMPPAEPEHVSFGDGAPLSKAASKEQPNLLTQKQGKDAATESLLKSLGVSQETELSLSQILTGMKEPPEIRLGDKSEEGDDGDDGDDAPAPTQKAKAKEADAQEAEDGDDKVYMTKEQFEFLMRAAEMGTLGIKDDDLEPVDEPSEPAPQQPAPIKVPEIEIKYPTPDEFNDMMVEPKKFAEWIQDHDRQLVAQTTSQMMTMMAPRVFETVANSFTPLFVANQFMDKNPDLAKYPALLISTAFKIAAENPHMTTQQKLAEVERRIGLAKKNIANSQVKQSAPQFARTRKTPATQAQGGKPRMNPAEEAFQKMIQMNKARLGGLEIR